MSVSAEDYLRTIYYLSEKQADKKLGIKAVDVATELNISKPSVSAMIKKLISLGFLRANPYSKIFFTEKGRNEAKRVMHNHRVIEVFLADVLKYDQKKVHDEAHRLEHAFSEESIKRLDAFLKNPKKSPHGETIPHEKN
ncbi:MAG: metal-dependent transcriptional regulator [bacterium]|nr:metal-dependent transcriptional regulator [bacterium]